MALVRELNEIVTSFDHKKSGIMHTAKAALHEHRSRKNDGHVVSFSRAESTPSSQVQTGEAASSEEAV
jgi:hypothetical protein